jgi:hypothetical protein
MHGTWSWHAYSYALGFLWKNRYNTARLGTPSRGLLRATRHLNGGNTLPRSPGGWPPDLRDGRGWTVGPPATRDTWTSGAPPPQISNDCKRHSAALGTATGYAIGVDAESDDLPRDRSRGGRSHHKAGRWTTAAPPTFLGDRLDGRRSLRLGSTHPAGHSSGADCPLVLSGGGSRLTQARAYCLVAPSRLQPARRRHFSAAGRWRWGRPRHVAPVDRRTGDIPAPWRLRRWVLIRGDAKLPRLPPLVAVVITISLGDLALFVLCLACSAPLLHRGLVLVKYRLL